MKLLEGLLKKMVEAGASDLHLTVGTPPQMRVDEVLTPMEETALTPEKNKEIIYSILSEAQIKKFEKDLELDLSFGIEGVSRFRANIFYQKGHVAGAFRAIPYKIMSFEELGLPKIVNALSKLPKGLILVTGATGSGKSTTLASIINKINEERHCHIITVEDPIEYVHEHKKSIVNQREVETDTQSFARALKYVLREDPDVILIGEMRDIETIESALTSAETGHLVFATLHTSDCVQTINRIIDVFPAHQQAQVRTQLSFVLQAVFSQQLIPRTNGRGRVLGIEVMTATAPIRSLIRENKAHQIFSVIQTSQQKGMQTMNQCLAQLVVRKHITREEALSRTTEPDDLTRLLSRGK